MKRHLTRRSLLQSAALALAAPRLAAAVLADRRAGARRRSGQEMAPRPVAVRRPEISGRLQAIRLRQRQRAEGRHGARRSPSAPSTISTSVVAGVKGTLAAGIDLIYDTLMAPALDEVSTEYGLLAEAVSYPADFSSVTYRLRAEAKWHDGKPVTPEDVIFSFDAFKKNSPQLSAYYRHVVKAEKTGEREVTFTFDGPGNRELPQIVGQLNVLPKHWWEGTDKNGKKRDIARDHARAAARQRRLPHQGFRAGPHHRLRARQGLLGQGPQRECRPRQFRRAALRIFPRHHRRARSLQGRCGRLAHREQRQELGDRLRLSRRSRTSASLKEEFPISSSGVMQAFAFNIRRAKFTDPRVRRAFNFAFDFEEMNKQIFFGQYKRIASYFEGTELAVDRTAGGPRAGDSRNRARQGAAGGLHHALHQSGQRHAGERAQQSARGDAAAARRPATRSATRSSSTPRPASPSRSSS